MPLFACRQCLSVENTALANYWWTVSEGKPALCSACDPEIGAWHGEFPRVSAEGFLVDQNGHLWRADEALPAHYKIIGVISPPTQGGNQ